MSTLNEALVEDAALAYLHSLGYTTMFGPDLAPDGSAAERASFQQVYLYDRLREAARRINPDHVDLVDEAIKRLERAESQNLIAENLRVHRLLVGGVPVEHRDSHGAVRTVIVRLIDFENPFNNDWLAVNQFTVIETKQRRPDVLVFVNGVPLGLMELKNPADKHATLRNAWNQIQTYRSDIPSLFAPNVVTVISDGTSATMSTFCGEFEHYAPWKTIDGRDVIDDRPALEVLIKGVFEPTRFLDIVKNFVVFSDEPKGIVKRVAKYHQYWAVNAAVQSTIVAAGPDGDRRGGVVWHTQGSGKSIEMLFYAAKIMREPRMANPTLVFLTDRNDLDDQLFSEVFAPAEILAEQPVQAKSRTDLRRLLQRASGGIIFTTLQKFAPEQDEETNLTLTDRRNVIVVADEAHRSQYGLTEKLRADGTLKSGLAKYMRDALPGATFLGFTGTPIESNDRSTKAVFGDYIDVYDLTRAVEDGATVKVFYESRLAKIHLSHEVSKELDNLVDQMTEQVEATAASKQKSHLARMEAIVGAEKRLDLIARDLVEHWEKRRKTMLGKAMVVTMSRRIAVRLYEKIVALRPDWHDNDPAKGKIKVIMTGSADDVSEFQPHIYSKDVRRELKARAKNAEDPLELVIVRDMWLTGFDSPVMHTMYVDKSMHGASLMQAIARVNRKFRDKPGGLIVDYIGLFPNLQKALTEYSPSDRNQTGVPIEEMVAAMLEKHDTIQGLLHGCAFNSSPTLPAEERLAEHAKVFDFVMGDPDRTTRFLDQVLALTKAYALAGSRDEAAQIHNDVRLFTGVRAAIMKTQNPDSGQGVSATIEFDTTVNQLFNEAIIPEEIFDIYKLAGLDTPDLSLLSDDFLDSLTEQDKPNLQIALLRRLLNDQIRSKKPTNIVQSRTISEQLEAVIFRYTNRSLTTAEVLFELIALAKETRRKIKRNEELGLNESEAAFYDAIAQNEAAVLQMGDATLRKIAIELVTSVRKSATIDWQLKESVRAKMRTKVRRLLAKYRYPPDLQEQAVELVLEQAETFASETTV